MTAVCVLFCEDACGEGGKGGSSKSSPSCPIMKEVHCLFVVHVVSVFFVNGTQKGDACES